MHLDNLTLLAVTVYVTGLMGFLLIFAWWQTRDMPALAWWGASYFMASLAAAGLGARGSAPDLLSIDLANALMIGAYAVCWNAARLFEGRKPMIEAGLAGVLLWVAACQIPAFYGSLPARIILVAFLVVVYILCTIVEFWRGRGEVLASRRALIVVLGIHATVLTVRMVLAVAIVVPQSVGAMRGGWVTLAAFESLLVIISLGFLLLAMAKERLELAQRQAALIDPLTGVANRRAFMDQAERLLLRHEMQQAPAALLLFDLDHFKVINDTFGHQTGDEILCLFCATAEAHLRPEDRLGRLGGEEFACLLPGASLGDAAQIAERLRAAFARAQATGHTATVSIGTAHTSNAGYELRRMIAAADEALYHAKSRGRDRVEQFVPSSGPPPPGSAEGTILNGGVAALAPSA